MGHRKRQLEGQQRAMEMRTGNIQLTIREYNKAETKDYFHYWFISQYLDFKLWFMGKRCSQSARAKGDIFKKNQKTNIFKLFFLFTKTQVQDPKIFNLRSYIRQKKRCMRSLNHKMFGIFTWIHSSSFFKPVNYWFLDGLIGHFWGNVLSCIELDEKIIPLVCLHIKYGATSRN